MINDHCQAKSGLQWALSRKEFKFPMGFPNFAQDPPIKRPICLHICSFSSSLVLLLIYLITYMQFAGKKKNWSHYDINSNQQIRRQQPLRRNPLQLQKQSNLVNISLQVVEQWCPWYVTIFPLPLTTLSVCKLSCLYCNGRLLCN